MTAYRLLAAAVDYPLHIGITEAGTTFAGTVKSAVGLGILLAEVSAIPCGSRLPAIRWKRSRSAFEILKSLGLRQRGVNFVSCPTCGRCQIDLIGVAEEVEKRLAGVTSRLPLQSWAASSTVRGRPGRRMSGLPAAEAKGCCSGMARWFARCPENEMVEALLAEVDKIRK